MKLTFNEFRAANVARALKWHPAGLESWSPSDWLTAVTGELGELASLLKMRNRERDGLPGNKFSPTDKPALAPVDFTAIRYLTKLDWIIIGGESGPKARPCDVQWIRSIVQQCGAAGTKVFVKQDSGPRPGMRGRIPEDLWIREFPR